MSTEMCPRCRQPRDLTSSRSTRMVTESDGSTNRIHTDVYHCIVCHTFVRSEEIREKSPDTGRQG